MKKKILIFTGAGVSAESGIETFRSGSDGLWNNYKIEEVATINAWRTGDKEKILNFYNERRKQLKEVEPNNAHKLIAELEKDYEVTVVTQNVDNLHERAGSTNVVHLHGELNKVRSTLNPKLVYDWEGDCNIGDKCEKGSQLRPHIVWFGENLDENALFYSQKAAEECDICIIVGTSLQVWPANEIPFHSKDDTFIYVIDPNDLNGYQIDMNRIPFIQMIKEKASTGMETVINDLKKD